MLTNLCVVFIKLTCTPEADFPVSPFLGEHGCSPPGEGHGCPFDGLKKAGGSKGTRPPGRPLGLAGFRLHPAPEADASGFIFRLYAGQRPAGALGAASPQSGSRRQPGAKHPACIIALGAFFSFNGLLEPLCQKTQTPPAPAGFVKVSRAAQGCPERVILSEQLRPRKAQPPASPRCADARRRPGPVLPRHEPRKPF